jgi:hypothetical protein
MNLTSQRRRCQDRKWSNIIWSLAELPWEFSQLLASRLISPHYDVDGLRDDLVTLQQLGSL